MLAVRADDTGESLSPKRGAEAPQSGTPGNRNPAYPGGLLFLSLFFTDRHISRPTRTEELFKNPASGHSDMLSGMYSDMFPHMCSHSRVSPGIQGVPGGPHPGPAQRPVNYRDVAPSPEAKFICLNCCPRDKARSVFWLPKRF